MANCTKLSNTPLTVSSAGADLVLSGVQGNPTTWDLVEDAGNFVDIVQPYKQCVDDNPELGQIEKSLDLVSHSYSSEHFLALGRIPGDDIGQFSRSIDTFLLDGTDGSAWKKSFSQVQSRLHDIGITQVRLLGCLTACTDAGREAMFALREVLRMPVLGTTEVLSHDNFTMGAFDPASLTGKLFSTEDSQDVPTCLPGLPGNRKDVLGVFDLDTSDEFSPKDLVRLAGLRTVLSPMREATRLQLKEAVGDEIGKSMPGLLAIPTWQYHVPVDDARRGAFHLLQILFDWKFVNIFSKRMVKGPSSNRAYAHSACYTVKDPMALWTLMTNLSPLNAPKPPPPE
jgi:hypothetical protein